VQVVYKRITPTTATVASVEINGADGSNTVASDGVSVAVAYTGSGWALVSKEARRLYAGANYKLDENGLEITQTALDGSAISTKYVANSQKHGLFRASDNKMLQGAKVLSDGSVTTVTQSLMDPDASDDLRIGLKAYTVSDGTHDLFRQGIKFQKGSNEHGQIRMSQRVYGNEECDLVFESTGDAMIKSLNRDVVLTSINGSVHVDGLQLTLDRASVTPNRNGELNCGKSGYGFNYFYGTHTSIQSTSDERAKHDMRPLEPETMLRFVMALDPSWYRLNVSPEDLMAGFKAQQFREAMMAAGIPLDFAGFNGKDADHLCLDYGQVIAPLVSVVQTQQKRIDNLEKRLAMLERAFDMETDF